MTKCKVKKIEKGLYQSQYEHDACGVGMIANIHGNKSHQLVDDALRVLENMRHRGAEIGKDGDGAGIMLQLPHEFILLQGIPVPEKGKYGTGLVFLPKDGERQQEILSIIIEEVEREGLQLMHLRTVPTDSECLGERARSTEPDVKQLFITESSTLQASSSLPVKLYLIRKRIEKRADDSEVEILGPAIPKRAYDIVNQLVDIIGYIDITWDEDGNAERWLYTRKTPTVMAGSRFKYLAPKIKFGYQELVDAIIDAIEKSEKLDGARVVDKSEQQIEEQLKFEDVREEASKLWAKLVTADANNADKILKKVEMIFGRKLKLSEITEDQVDLMQLVVLEMRDMVK